MILLIKKVSNQEKGTLFRNIQNTGRSNYYALGSRQVPTYWLGFMSYVPSCVLINIQGVKKKKKKI